MLRAVLALLCCGSLLLAQEEEPNEPKAAPEKPAVKDLGNGKFEVGLVTFDRTTREISFPAQVNMKDGPLEYAIVHWDGKIHEAILITKTRPVHVNIALKLLDYKESTELFVILDDDFRPTGKYPRVPEETRNAARVEILLKWEDANRKPQEATLNDWITYTVTGKPLEPLPWVYGGSYFHENSFQAEVSGDLVALFVSNGALFNWPGKDNNLDDVWLPNTERIPDVGTSVTVTLKPAVPTKTTP